MSAKGAGTAESSVRREEGIAKKDAVQELMRQLAMGSDKPQATHGHPSSLGYSGNHGHPSSLGYSGSPRPSFQSRQELTRQLATDPQNARLSCQSSMRGHHASIICMAIMPV